jgi:hypothetical protein
MSATLLPICPYDPDLGKSERSFSYPAPLPDDAAIQEDDR